MSCPTVLHPAEVHPAEIHPAVLHLADGRPSANEAVENASDAVGFANLGLPRALRDAVAALGFDTPTAIQASAIPALRSGRDVVGVAQTGTGKTAAFGLPLLARIDPQVRGVQAIVLTPTRELAVQVADALVGFAAHLDGVEVAAVYGGAPMSRQVTALRRGAQVVVGTPGRIIDHLDRGSLHLDAVAFAVLDEADEMLRMGFVEEVDRILDSAPRERQTALFSATMPDAIRAVAAKHLRRPVDVSVAASATPVDAIEQRYAVLPFRQKVDALVRILAVRTAATAVDAAVGAVGTDGAAGAAGAADAAVVFVRTRSACEEVGAELIERGVNAAVISGDVAQPERERTITRLRNRQVDVLVATDVAARGLDVERIGLVVNFDAPTDPETYVHRVGRTGRAGRAGTALLFVTPKEIPRLRAIERAIGQRLEQLTPPTVAEVTAHRAVAQLQRAVVRHGVGRLDACRTALESAADASGLAVTEIAAALLAVAIGDDGTPPARDEAAHTRGTAYRMDAADGVEPHRVDAHRRGDNRHGEDRRHPDREARSGVGTGRGAHRPGEQAPNRYTVQVGRKHGVRPAGIVGAITGEGGLSGSDLGRIDIYDSYSVVEISVPVQPAAMTRIHRASVSGQQLRISPERSGARGGARPDRAERPDRTDRTDHSGRRTRPGHPDRFDAPGRRGQNSAGWTSDTRPGSRRGRLPSGKRDSALPGTPRTS